MRKGKMINSGIIIALAVLVMVFTVIAIISAQEQTAPPAEAAPAPTAEAAPAPPPKVDSGDTAWLLTSSALVLAMTAPGLALFYCGMVRRKNVLGPMVHSFILLCLLTFLW